eukprot:TRINITY_DN3902_c0_g2_i1.p1 TRINITY_DN3902_c0_g2~~TRINITY_DN3902_c0_g2_i1.p1  ORF type:complete len:485 (+),score=93.01 TRINITY_DN3902_c0_g2_i1:155-1456(+)
MTCSMTNPVPMMMADNMMFPQPIGFVPMVAPAAVGDASTMMNFCLMQQPMGMSNSYTPQMADGFSRAPRESMSGSGNKPGPAGKKHSPPQQQQQHQGNHAHSEAATAEDDSTGKGVISLLQEFVQCSKQFPSPQHRSILQWGFDTRMADFTTLEFRAQVAFLLDGVPHHVAGAWQLSKKLAQRDAAERCLGFFVGSWGTFLMSQADSDNHSWSNKVAAESHEDPVDLLATFCQHFPPCEGQKPECSLSWDGDRCSATLEVNLLGVMHKFAGSQQTSAKEATNDAAKRVLWYLQCPGFENLYEPDPRSQAVVGKELPMPPANWANQAAEGESVQAAERKTALMRVQNRLQQVFARRLQPGESVWEWAYETDSQDTAWPPLSRAKVTISPVGRTVEGPWVRGQREAQIEACKKVTSMLDSGALRAPSTNGNEGDQ